MLRLAAILAAAAVAAATRDPVFAQQWGAVTTAGIVLNQGGTTNAAGEVCCDYTSPGCKVQVESEDSRMYFDLAHNRTANFPATGGAIVTLYNDGKEYSVDPATGKCVAYCPLDEQEGTMYPFGNASAITGVKAGSWNGKAATAYTSPTVIPVLNVTMEIQTWYMQLVGASGPDTPIAEVVAITPFGGPQIGTETQTWSQFVAGPPDASKFTVKDAASCPKANQCASSSSSQVVPDLAPVAAPRPHTPGHAAVSTTMPALAQQWSAAVVQHVAINEGGQQGPNGQICCPKATSGCKLETQYLASKQFFNYPANMSATYFADGTGVVTLFNDNKQYGVNAKGDCQSYCPTQFPMFPFGLPVNSTDEGAATYNGVKAEKWQFLSTLSILNVTMGVNDYYLDQTTTPATPVAFTQEQTPFGGPAIGGQTTLFQDFTVGAPDASHFVVNNKAQCPQAQNCGQDAEANAAMLAGL